MEQLLKSKREGRKQCQVSMKNSDQVNIDIMHPLMKTRVYNLRITFSLPGTHTDSVVLVRMFLSG